LGETLSAAARTPRARLDILRAAGRAYVRFSMDHPALFRLMYGGFTASQTDQALVEASMSEFEGFLKILATHSRRDVDDPELLDDALLVWSVVHGLSHLALGGQLGYFGPDAGQIIDATLARARFPFETGEPASAKPASSGRRPRR
jgi:hypothetical protein